MVAFGGFDRLFRDNKAVALHFFFDFIQGSQQRDQFIAGTPEYLHHQVGFFIGIGNQIKSPGDFCQQLIRRKRLQFLYIKPHSTKQQRGIIIRAAF